MLGLDLRSDDAAAEAARAAVAQVLAGSGMPSDRLHDAMLVTSELVTNAVRHGGAPVRLEVTTTPGRVLLRVYDTAATSPAPRPAGPDDEGGRGLLLVETLASAWGCAPHRDRPGKYVWAELTW